MSLNLQIVFFSSIQHKHMPCHFITFRVYYIACFIYVIIYFLLVCPLTTTMVFSLILTHWAHSSFSGRSTVSTETNYSNVSICQHLFADSLADLVSPSWMMFFWNPPLTAMIVLKHFCHSTCLLPFYSWAVRAFKDDLVEQIVQMLLIHFSMVVQLNILNCWNIMWTTVELATRK